jgi:hypothetical protein
MYKEHTDEKVATAAKSADKAVNRKKSIARVLVTVTATVPCNVL